MAITNYAELLAAVASWAKRTDLTDVIPDFVALTEARLNDLLVLKDMETEAMLATVVGSDLVALPSDYVSPLAMWIVILSVRVPLIPALATDFGGTSTNTIPKYWSVDGANIQFDAPADRVYSCPFRYVAKSNLSATNTTNALLSRRPDIYLAGAMVEVSRYTRDPDMFAAWEPKFVKAVGEVKAADSRNKSIVPMRVDSAMRTTRSNIFAGE